MSAVRAAWPSWACAALGVGGLLLVSMIQSITPPVVHVRWEASLSPARQAQLEELYGLHNGEVHDPAAPRSLAYELSDASHANVAALVHDPAVADTHHIDRDRERVEAFTGVAGALLNLPYQALRLYAGPARAVLFALFAAVVALGLRQHALRRGHRETERELRDPPVDARDVFDRLPDSPDSGSLMPKVVCGALLPVAIGIPIVETWRACLLGGLALAVLFSSPRRGAWRLVGVTGVVIAVVLGKGMLPRADIAEAHNLFLVSGDAGPLENGLPPEVFQSWRLQFLALYPPDVPVVPFSWRAHDVKPAALYAQSADAIWRQPKYTRQVDSIHFTSLAEFRGGFVNETGDGGSSRYNFWAGELRRESMPFYVMYELSPASVGSSLRWSGQLFWEGAEGTFEEIIHEQPASRPITGVDVSRRVYAAFFPARDSALLFEFLPSLTLRVGAWLDLLLTLIGAVAVVAIALAPRWGPYLRAVTLFASGYAYMAWTAPGRFLGSSYAPQGGGDDGLAHDGWGHLMALLSGRGEIVEALKGAESVYWFTPGTRYFRMIEKLIFGDTNHLYALTLACCPIVVFYLARRFLGGKLAWVVAALFCVMPVGNLSFLQYVTNARLGYGEALGAGLFLLGLTLLLRSQPAWGGTRGRLSPIALGGAALAGSMFVRPNFALAVVGLGAVYAYASLARRDFAAAAAVAVGLALALWMPFHNWHYGGEFYLISSSGMQVAVTLGVGDYLAACGDLLRGRFETPPVTAVFTQLGGWLGGPGFVSRPSLAPFGWLAHVARLCGLIAAVLVTARWVVSGGRTRPALGVVAASSVLAHAPMLFIFSTADRYAMLAWDLSLLVLVVWIGQAMLASPSEAVSMERRAHVV